MWACPWHPRSVSCQNRESEALRAGEEGAPPNQPRASGSSASQRTPSMLCDCHVLDTGAHCCPCFSTHSTARALTGSKSLHFQIWEGRKTGTPGDCSTGDLCCAEGPVRGWVETWVSFVGLHSGGLCLRLDSFAGSGKVEKHVWLWLQLLC